MEVSFTLLDAAHVVVTCNGWEDLRVFQFDPPSNPTMDILRINLPPKSLPPGCPRRLMECSIPSTPPNAPFWPDPDLRMITVAYVEAQTSKRAVLLIPYATFKRLLQIRPLLQILGLHPHRVTWRDWGREALRLSLSAPARDLPWTAYQYHSYGSRFSLLMSNWSKFPRSSTIVTFDLNPWAEKYARSLHSEVDMPHLKGCLGSGWKKIFHSSEHEGRSSIPYAIHHSFREDHEADGGFTVIVTDPFGYTEVVSSLLLARSITMPDVCP